MNDWVPYICPQCHGTGQAPSTDGRTECGFCVDGLLTDDLRDELAAAWGPILRRVADAARSGTPVVGKDE